MPYAMIDDSSLGQSVQDARRRSDERCTTRTFGYCAERECSTFCRLCGGGCGVRGAPLKDFRVRPSTFHGSLPQDVPLACHAVRDSENGEDDVQAVRKACTSNNRTTLALIDLGVRET